MSKHYGVKIGKQRGIYTSWPQCSAQVTGFPGALYKSFKTREEALTYVYGQEVPDHEKLNLELPLRAQHRLLQEVTIERLNSGLAALRVSTLDIVLDKNKHQDGESFTYGELILPRVPKKPYHLYDRKILDTHSRHVIIYIDGSKRKKINHRGSGAYCRFNGQDYYQSVPFCDALGHHYKINPEDFSKLSSPTMEYLALANSLSALTQLKMPVNPDGSVRIPNPRLRIVFVGDYNGVKHFTEGNWQAKEDYIIKIRDFCQMVIRWLAQCGVDVVLHSIPGHQGILGNELSDIMAKSPVPYDSMSNLVTAISTSLVDYQ